MVLNGDFDGENDLSVFQMPNELAHCSKKEKTQSSDDSRHLFLPLITARSRSF